MQKADMSAYMVAKLSGVDETYVRRLINGERRNPGRDVAIALGLGLADRRDISDRDIERLVRAAGHKLTKVERDDLRTRSSEDAAHL